MGSLPDSDDWDPHTVTLDGYWIDQTEVTNAQFAVMLNVKGNPWDGFMNWLEIQQPENAEIVMVGPEFQPDPGKDNHPVVEVSWPGANTYCDWIGGRLPTEAEWEYAARGSGNIIYPWGNEEPTCEITQFAGCGDYSVPVGSLSDEGDSWVGAKDMAGNVWELVADYYAEYPTEPQVNPTGPETGEWGKQVARGGSFLSSPDTLHMAYRRPGGGNQPNLGFRCAVSDPSISEPDTTGSSGDVPREMITSQSPSMADISAYLKELTTQDEFAGAVLIAQDGDPVFKGAYGQADRSLNILNNIDTKFNLGSIDKMFTAVAALQLVEEGELSLDDKIMDILPEYADTRIPGHATIHQLLTHMSGMGDYIQNENYMDIRRQIQTTEDYLPLFSNTPLKFEPGAQFGYSNAGYIVLGLIIEKLTGESYYDYVQKNIFEPSGMINTAAYSLDAETPNLAIGYTYLDAQYNHTGQLTDNSFILPMRGGSAGGGYSTVEDLHQFATALLDDQLLSPTSTVQLLEGKVELAPNIQYAYGFFDQIWKDQRVVSDSGVFPGVCSYIGMYLDTDYTLIILSNTDEGCYSALEFIRERLFEN
jgi:CubicO group peptidase (beta-lactamase class C family)